MEFQLPPSQAGKMRIVQELVPGKQVTLAHIIANPDPIVYKKLGFIDRFSGTLIFTGSVSAVEEAIQAICDYLIENLGFTVCSVTRT